MRAAWRWRRCDDWRLGGGLALGWLGVGLAALCRFCTGACIRACTTQDVLSMRVEVVPLTPNTPSIHPSTPSVHPSHMPPTQTKTLTFTNPLILSPPSSLLIASNLTSNFAATTLLTIQQSHPQSIYTPPPPNKKTSRRLLSIAMRPLSCRWRVHTTLGRCGIDWL